MIKNSTTNDAEAFAHLSQETLFLVWGPPSHGPRSQVFARKLGITERHFLSATQRRGLLAAPLKYSYQAVATLHLLFRKRPKVVFIQSPPSFAVLFVYIYCALVGGRYVIDAHSDAFQRIYWTWPRWLHTFLARRAVTTIVTNEHFREQLEERGAHAFVLRDIPASFPTAAEFSLEGRFNIAVVNTFARDEPIHEILEAARLCDDVHFYVTGKLSEAATPVVQSASDNVHFTGYLPREDYYSLLSASQAVMCLTTRNHTMQRGACEALSLGRPIITSDWPLLRQYFRQGTVYTKNTPDGISQALSEMKLEHDRYEQEIKLLQRDQQHEWRENLAALIDLIETRVA